MNSDEYRRRYDALLDLVSQRLPNFIEAVASKETDTLIFHQDAFAADLQNEELVLLAAAIKFALTKLTVSGSGFSNESC